MDKHILTGSYFDTIETIAPNESWLISASAVIAAQSGTGIECGSSDTGNSITVAGTVTGESSAIISLAERTKLSIAATGTVVGAIDFGGTGSSISNAGHMISTDVGILAEGGGIKVSNSGSIKAANTGIFVDEIHGNFVNAKTGVITAGDTALEIHGSQGVNQRFVNNGRISGGELAIEASAANETVVNTGRITGDVDLGSGDDVFDARHGTLNGKVLGGLGADTLITDNARIHLVENLLEGFDQVKSSVSYKLNANIERLELTGTKNINATGKHEIDVLMGNAGNNVMKGLGGPDIINGGKGNDRLIGGAGNDQFTFATGNGKDEIVDFSDGDKVYVHDWKAINTFAQVKGHASNHGADVWITAGHDTLIIDHMHKADLQAADFLF